MYSHYEIWAMAQERHTRILKEAAQGQRLAASARGFDPGQLPSQSPATAARPEAAFFNLTMRHRL